MLAVGDQELAKGCGNELPESNSSGEPPPEAGWRRTRQDPSGSRATKVTNSPLESQIGYWLLPGATRARPLSAIRSQINTESLRPAT